MNVSRRRPPPEILTFSFKLYTLKIKLSAGALRKVSIPDYYTFAHLHQLFLYLFDWMDGHLHKFEVPFSQEPPIDYTVETWYQNRNKYTWVSDPRSFLRSDDFEDRNEAHTPLSFGFKNVGDSVEFEYDFSVYWPAKISLIRIEQKLIKTSEYVPRITIVGGKDPTISDKKRLNEELSRMKKFVFFPLKPNTNIVGNDIDDKPDDDCLDDDDEDDDLQHGPWRLAPWNSINNQNSMQPQSMRDSYLSRKRKRHNDDCTKPVKKKQNLPLDLFSTYVIESDIHF